MNQWNSVIYQAQYSSVPAQRWGHRLLKVHDQLLLFGGYGGLPEGQGQYLQDLWKFDLRTSTWHTLKTSGSVPEARSNYTIHFHQQKQQVILFGGGTESKVRFNTVHILNINNLQWRQITPKIGQQAPWERTYHAAQLYQNFLIVFGGQGISNLDLEDLWAFDLKNQNWIRLEPQGQCPTRRRFASSAIEGCDFYLIGGCQDNYNLLGEMYRLSLKPLLSGNYKQLKWQCLLQKNDLLSRWGHSTDSYNKKLYIFSGRINDDRDNSDLIEYDCLTGVLKKIENKGKIPDPRRRHATTVVGSSLLAFGGYNGKYLNDFYYIKLPENDQDSCRLVVADTKQKCIQEMQLSEKIVASNQRISVADEAQLCQFRTQIQKVKVNAYFRASLKQKNLIKLPSICTMKIFRIIHLALLYSRLYIWRDINLLECFQIAQALQYFCMCQHLKQLANWLISKITPQNALSVLILSTRFSMEQLGAASAITYIQNARDQQTNLIPKIASNLQHSKVLQIIKRVQKQNIFQITQRKLSVKGKGMLSKTVETIKNIFSSQPSGEYEEKKPASRKKSCLFLVWQCLQQMNRLFSSYGAVGI